MIVFEGAAFFKFVDQHRDEFKDSNTINTLMSLRDLARNCCKCERKQKRELAVNYFGALGQNLNEKDKQIIKELNGGESVKIMMQEHLVVEIL